jgi:hypothetical protein
MPKLLLPVVGLALVSAAALVVPLMPRAEATASVALPSMTVGNASAVEQAGMKCVTRRVCRQSDVDVRGGIDPRFRCAWRKVCKRS